MKPKADTLKITTDTHEAAALFAPMPVVPIAGSVLFPSLFYPFIINSDLAARAVDRAMTGNQLIFIVAPRTQREDPARLKASDLFSVGTIGRVMQISHPDSGPANALVLGISRARIITTDSSPGGVLFARLNPIPDQPVEENANSRAVIRIVKDQLETAASLGKEGIGEFIVSARDVHEPGRIADLAASTLDLEIYDAQAVLETFDPVKRLSLVSRLLASELEVLQIQQRILSSINSGLEEKQRHSYLIAQHKAIHKELGLDEENEDPAAEFRSKILAVSMPPAAEKHALREASRLSRMNPDSSEANIIRNYIDLMLALPWNTRARESLDLSRARAILDSDHFGLDDIKERIIETLAIRKLNPSARSPIICFAGPPGVGKTSLGQSIARALGRPFFRFSVGGVRDEAEIRGHRRTYVGAMPGRIISGLKSTAVANPVFMIDEIDKIASDHRGDPASALLEVLDPAQNSSFSDHYLEVPFDLSEILFITTANSLHTIPAPLRDRMEIIHLHGYTDEEKINIATSYLIPRQLAACGLRPGTLTFRRDALRLIIESYTREAGVRNLEREISRAARKIATRVASGDPRQKFTVTRSGVATLLGPPSIRHQRRRRADSIAIANGLAWTESGGELLTVEAVTMPGNGQLIITGQLGDVMRESALAALSFIKSNSAALGITALPGPSLDIHIHVPAGAVPKDGPSAGVTIAATLLSLFIQQPIRCDVAMTGEISLHGDILPVGGLKSKILAARRESISTIIVPEANRTDISLLSPEDTAGLEIVFVRSFPELISRIFAQTRTPSARRKAAS